MSEFSRDDFRALFDDRPDHIREERAMRLEYTRVGDELYALRRDAQDTKSPEQIRTGIEKIDTAIAKKEAEIQVLRDRRTLLHVALVSPDLALDAKIAQKKYELETIEKSPIYKGDYPYHGTPLGDAIREWELGIISRLRYEFVRISKEHFDTLFNYATETTHGDLDDDGDEIPDTVFKNTVNRLYSLLRLFDRMQQL